MGELLNSLALCGGVRRFDAAEVGKDITFQEATAGACGGDFGDFRIGDVFLVEKGRDGGIERVFAALAGAGGRRCCGFRGGDRGFGSVRLGLLS